ncbi:MAG TPA: hypothetical protein PLO67_15205 [Saprospiraceae bacterium]|nr:hypothetical protein [Saprospiraceae bacterium]HPI05427.1 hypothetical protein [Saprospiraceae bacterium]
MPDHANNCSGNLLRVISETVAFRYSDDAHLMLVGEAEIVIILTGCRSEPGVNLHSVRVDILAAYNAEGQDIYTQILADTALKNAVERTALEHYLSPPKVPVGLPGRTEW